MKKLLLFHLLVLLSFPIGAQNLVPNPGFEDSLPNPIWNRLIIGQCAEWTAPNPGTSDHYHDLNPFWPGVASTIHLPRTGDAYAGIFNYNGLGTGVRETLVVKLLDTLEAGKRYCIEYYVSRAMFSGFVCNSIGAYFSPQPTTNSATITSLTPQFQNPVSNTLADKIGWVRVQGSFYAAGGELFLTIGNFTLDSLSSLANMMDGNPGDSSAYYYIDDVSLVACEDPMAAHPVLEIPGTVEVYPSPALDRINVVAPGMESVMLFDAMGREVQNVKVVNVQPGKFTLDVSGYAGGVYFLGIYSRECIVTRKVVIRE